MLEFTYQARLMGTDLDVVIINPTEEVDIFPQLVAFGQLCEAEFSRFIDESLLSQLNRTKKSSVSARFWEVFAQSQALYRLTEGVFNPLISPLQIGYEADFRTHGADFKSQSQRVNTDFEGIKLDPRTRTMTLAPDQFLDFGGFLKGWVAQKMSAMTTDCVGSIINLGGDIYVRGQDLHSATFEMQIDHPLDDSKSIRVQLQDQALATSGTYARKWAEKHHIMDPKMQDSSQSDLISASVIASDGALADALATTSIVLGTEKALTLLDRCQVQYALIDRSGRITKNFNSD